MIGRHYHPETVEWVERVQVNGGAVPSDKTTSAASRLLVSLVASAIYDKIKLLNFFAPDSIEAAECPIIAAYGNDAWTNSGFVTGDLSVQGLQGDNAHYLDTGANPADWATNANASLFVYVSGDDLGGDVEIGCAQSGSIDFLLQAHIADGTTIYEINIQAVSSVEAGQWNGYYCASTTANTTHNIYKANSDDAHASIDSDSQAAGTPPSTRSLFVFAHNFLGSAGQFTLKRLSCAGSGVGLLAAESSSLFDAIQQLRIDLGGGYA